MRAETVKRDVIRESRRAPLSQPTRAGVYNFTWRVKELRGRRGGRKKEEKETVKLTM